MSDPTTPATSPHADPSTGGQSVDRDTWRAYYLLQYERVSHHESGRLVLTNSIIGASVVALGLTTLANTTMLTALSVVPFVVAIVNVFAITYTFNARKWVKIHQARAKRVLELLEPALLTLQREVNRDQGVGADASYRRSLNGSGAVLVLTHGLIAALSFVLGIAWIRH